MAYDHYDGTRPELFELPTSGEAFTELEYRRAIENVRDHVAGTKPNFFGYQANQSLDYAGLAEFLNVQLNNLGGPFTDGGFRLNVKWVERAVLDYFAWLWRGKRPWDPEDEDAYWGYVLSMGSTEGNIYGLWNGREYLAGESILEDDHRGERSITYTNRALAGTVPNDYRPIALYSQDIHYSIGKALRALQIPTIGEFLAADRPPSLDPDDYRTGVPTHPEEDERAGEVDIERLAQAAQVVVERGHPLLVVFNYGTAFRGAYDDVEEAVTTLDQLVVQKHGSLWRTVKGSDDEGSWTDERTWTWYHVDGALGAPFGRYAHELAEPRALPKFDFETGVHSISASGHKWMGAPWPCGVYMTKRRFQLRPDHISYIGGADTTFAGSRNGLSSLILWSYLARTGVDENEKKAQRLFDLADRAYAELQGLERWMSEQHDIPLYVARSRNALTIRLRKLNKDLIAKYSLSNDTIKRIIDGEPQLINVSHIFIMDHVDDDQIDRFVADIKAAGPGAVEQLVEVQADTGDRARGLTIASTEGGFHA